MHAAWAHFLPLLLLLLYLVYCGVAWCGAAVDCSKHNVGQGMMTAAEIFISLHSVDAGRDGVPLRRVMSCLDPCMKEDMRPTFPPEAMAVALQQLLTR